MLKIGNVIKAMDTGRWFKVPAVSGEFGLKLKQLLPGEQFALSERVEAIRNDAKIKDKDKAVFTERRNAVISKIVDWRDLQDADGNEIPFDAAALVDGQFSDAFFGFTVIGSGYLLNWIVGKVNKSDSFTEGDASFLANT